MCHSLITKLVPYIPIQLKSMYHKEQSPNISTTQPENGGAMCLHGHSTFELHHGSHVVFHSNHASEFGRAVYVTLPQGAEVDLFPRCFISYNDTIEDNPDGWNSTIVFTTIQENMDISTSPGA